MGVLGQYGGNALKYWGSILASAYQGASTADMWTAIRNQQAEYGLSKPGASAPDVSVLRGYANRIVNSARALAAANPGDSILPAMMAVAPYTASTAQDLAAAPTYMVRYQNTVQANDGTVTTVWNTSIYTGTDMPATVGELMDSVQANATEIAAQGSASSSTTPRGTSLGVSNIEITVV